jgi:hypothetical protein
MSFEDFREQNAGVVNRKRLRELLALGRISLQTTFQLEDSTLQGINLAEFDLVDFDLFIDHVNPVAGSYDGDMIIYICEDKKTLDGVMEFVKRFKPSLLEFFDRDDEFKTIYIDRSLGDGIIDAFSDLFRCNFGITVHSCS